MQTLLEREAPVAEAQAAGGVEHQAVAAALEGAVGRAVGVYHGVAGTEFDVGVHLVGDGHGCVETVEDAEVLVHAELFLNAEVEPAAEFLVDIDSYARAEFGVEGLGGLRQEGGGQQQHCYG